MNILIVNGNSAADSFCKSLCLSYEKNASAAGHHVSIIHIGEMRFDPVLHEGYHAIQPLEPDLLHFQEELLRAHHLVIVYPTWWGGLPALLKGLFDRSFCAGFAYRYHEKGPLWDKLLKGRSAHIITTMDAPGIWYRLVYRSSGNRMLKHAILKFCGISPVKISLIPNIKNKSREALTRELKRVNGWIPEYKN